MGGCYLLQLLHNYFYLNKWDILIFTPLELHVISIFCPQASLPLPYSQFSLAGQLLEESGGEWEGRLEVVEVPEVST